MEDLILILALLAVQLGGGVLRHISAASYHLTAALEQWLGMDPHGP